MKKFLPLLLVTAFVFAGTMFPVESAEKTVEGTLVDTKCYGMMPKANLGNDHKLPGKDGSMMTVPNCATACSGMGIPAGIVVDGEDGSTTYVIIVSTTALKDHMGKTARVTGKLVYDGGIMPGKVEVKDGDEWVDVTPGAMM